MLFRSRRGRRITLLAGLSIWAAPLYAQFSDLATTGDGSVVYFASRHARAGSNEPYQGRIYRVGPGGGLELFAEREREDVEPNDLFIRELSNFYRLSAPAVSDDGSVLAFAGSRECAGRSCIGVTREESSIEGGGRETVVVPGRVSLSPNGRFALGYGGQWPGFIPTLRDLDADAEPEYVGVRNVSRTGSAVANDGTVVHIVNSGISLLRRSESISLRSEHELVEEAVIDGSAKTVVYVSRWRSWPESSFPRLRVLDVESGRRRTLAEGLGEYFQPDLSTDGSRVLFLSTARLDGVRRVDVPQAFVVDADGSGLRQLTFRQEGVQSAELSGDGRVVFAVTSLGRLIRLDAETGEETELIPRTLTTEYLRLSGELPFDSRSLVAGSLQRIRGAGFVLETVFADALPLPRSLGEFRLLIEGREVPLVSVSPSDVVFQVPWELRPGVPLSLLSVEIETDSGVLDSPFQPERRRPWQLAERNAHPIPAPLELGTPSEFGAPLSLAANAQYELVTADHPIRPGAVVHLYATGLGPVTPSVLTGRAAPVGGPLSHIDQPLGCRTAVRVDGELERPRIPVLFAGLAPSLVGVYQISLRIPADLPAGSNPNSAPGSILAVDCIETTFAVPIEF